MQLDSIPLHIVLSPHMRLPLHTFELRYRVMIRACIDEERPFRVALIRSNGEDARPRSRASAGRSSRGFGATGSTTAPVAGRWPTCSHPQTRRRKTTAYSGWLTMCRARTPGPLRASRRIRRRPRRGGCHAPQSRGPRTDLERRPHPQHGRHRRPVHGTGASTRGAAGRPHARGRSPAAGKRGARVRVGPRPGARACGRTRSPGCPDGGV